MQLMYFELGVVDPCSTPCVVKPTCSKQGVQISISNAQQADSFEKYDPLLNACGKSSSRGVYGFQIEWVEECQIVGKHFPIRNKVHSHSHIILVVQFFSCW